MVAWLLLGAVEGAALGVEGALGWLGCATPGELPAAGEDAAGAGATAGASVAGALPTGALCPVPGVAVVAGSDAGADTGPLPAGAPVDSSEPTGWPTTVAGSLGVVCSPVVPAEASAPALTSAPALAFASAVDVASGAEPVAEGVAALTATPVEPGALLVEAGTLPVTTPELPDAEPLPGAPAVSATARVVELVGAVACRIALPGSGFERRRYASG